MNRNMKKSFWVSCTTGLILLTVGILFFVLVIAPFQPQIQNVEKNIMPLTEGWSLQQPNGTLQPVNMPYAHRQSDTEPFTLTYTISPTLQNNTSNTLLITSYYCDMQIELDNELIYTYTGPNTPVFKTDGKAYMLVRLPYASAGKTLTVTYTPQFKGIDQYRLDTPTIGTKATLLVSALVHSLPGALLMFIMFLLGVGLMVYHLINIRKPRYDSNMLYLGLFCVLCANYLLMNQDWVHLMHPSPFALYVVEFLSHGALIMPMLLILRNITHGINHRLVSMCLGICVINLSAQLILYFFTPLELRQMLGFSHLTMIITIPVIAGIFCNRKGMIINARLEIIYSIVPLAFFGVLDIVLHYLYPNIKGGKYLQVGVVVFVALQFYYNYRRYWQLFLRSRENEFYRRVAYLDMLTGIKNRNAYENDLNQLEEMRGNYPTIWCLVMDLNGLKAINDAYGHAAGDGILQAMGHILETISQSAHGVYRTGGDEFIILLTGCEMRDVRRLIENLYDERSAYNAKASHPLQFSMGFAQYDAKSHATLADMIHEADEMMYNDKHWQKNRAQFG